MGSFSDRGKKGEPVRISWKPDKASEIPVYRQIMDFVRNKVSTGEWAVGARLPSQRELSEMFGVNRSTVMTAMEELASYGILKGGRGGGTRIASNTWSLMLPETQAWGRYVSQGTFQSNHPLIQEINRWEFEPGMKRLGTGEPDPRLFPRDMWSRIMEEMKHIPSLHYLEPLGLPELRAGLSGYLKSQGISATPSSILITSGSLQALQLISVCLLKPGTTVYTEAPTYLKSLQIFQSAGMQLAGLPMDREGIEYWAMPKRKGERAPGSSPVLYTIPTNHNPTGVTMSRSRRKQLMNFCEERQLPVIEDCAYQELWFDGMPPESLKQMDQSGMVIYLGTASKTLAPGLRVGWIVASEELVQRLGDVKMQLDYGASSLSQWAFEKFLTSGLYGQYTAKMREEMRQRRDWALEVLDKYGKEFAVWNIPAGGFYIWMTLKQQISMETLFYRAVGDGVLLNPGDIYDFKENHSLRISYSYLGREEFENAIQKLFGIIREMVGK